MQHDAASSASDDVHTSAGAFVSEHACATENDGCKEQARDVHHSRSITHVSEPKEHRSVRPSGKLPCQQQHELVASSSGCVHIQHRWSRRPHKSIYVHSVLSTQTARNGRGGSSSDTAETKDSSSDSQRLHRAYVELLERRPNSGRNEAPSRDHSVSAAPELRPHCCHCALRDERSHSATT